MPAGAGVFETFGYLFSATDLATPVVTKMQKTIDVVEKAMTATFRGIVTSAEKMMDGTADVVDRVRYELQTTTYSIGKLVKGVMRAFEFPAFIKQINPVTASLHVFGDAVKTAFGAPIKIATAALDGLLTGMFHIVTKTLDAGEAVETFARGVGASMRRAYKYATTRQLTFADMFKAIIAQTPKAMKVFTTGFTGAFKMIGGAFNGFKKLVGGVGAAGGGLFSMLLGPIGPILRLLQPLIDLVSDALAPAFELLGGYIKNAFAPLDIVGTTIAQSLQPAIQKFVGPLGALLATIAMNVGSIIQDLVSGKGPATGILKAFHELGKVVANLLPPVLKLATVLLTKVFSPLLGWLAGKIAVAAKFWGPYIDKLADRVADFFDNFGDYMSTFYDEFIAPIPAFFTDDIPAMFKGALSTISGFFSSVWDVVSGAFKDIYSFLGLDVIGDKVSGIFSTIVDVIMHPITALKGFINSAIIDPINSVLEYLDFDQLTRLDDGTGRKGYAAGETTFTGAGAKFGDGGIVTGPTRALIGEKGPEVILPLEPDVLEKMLGPALARVPTPSMDGAMRLLARAVDLLDNIDQNGKKRADVRRAVEDTDLDMAIGTAGLGA